MINEDRCQNKLRFLFHSFLFFLSSLYLTPTKRKNDEPLEDTVLRAIRTVSRNQQKMLAELTSHQQELLTANTNITNLTTLVTLRAQQQAEGRF